MNSASQTFRATHGFTGNALGTPLQGEAETSPLRAALELLDAVQSASFEFIERLESKLHPVLAPPYPRPANADRPAENTMLIEALSSIRERQIALNERLNELTERAKL